jgi:hypothetical protein
MKTILNVLGIICLPVGAIWLLQGTKVITIGFMAGHRRWIVVGGVVLIVGILVLIFNNKKSAKV